ncbi:MAG TPA: BA14K family protein [Rhizobiaceae bacterium]|nr:BA14K family protein [Rhizobiaceae bacterium]
MNRFFKSAILTAAVAATALTAIPANAGDHWRHRHHHHGGDALAAGAIGLAVGALAGAALSQPRPAPVYVDRYYPPAPPVRYHYRPAPEVVYVREAPEPWTRGWYRECSIRYRSFDPGTGTYLGYDGREHFCELN